MSLSLPKEVEAIVISETLERMKEGKTLIEAVLCKDCHFYEDRRNPACKLSGLRVSKEDYCSKARKK